MSWNTSNMQLFDTYGDISRGSLENNVLLTKHITNRDGDVKVGWIFSQLPSASFPSCRNHVTHHKIIQNTFISVFTIRVVQGCWDSKIFWKPGNLCFYIKIECTTTNTFLLRLSFTSAAWNLILVPVFFLFFLAAFFLLRVLRLVNQISPTAHLAPVLSKRLFCLH